MARRLVIAVSSFVLLWPLAGYPLVLAIIAKIRPRPVRAAPSPLPSMTVVVPTHNEAATIAARLENIDECDYPRDRIEVITVDSGSSDGTAEIAQRAMHGLGIGARLIRQRERSGKAAAINEAIAASLADVVVVTDAPTTFAQDALRCIGEAFNDPAVGAATGHFEVTGDGSSVQEQEALFWRLRNALRKLESAVDSTPFLSGELCAFRRALVPALHTDTLADDMDIAMQVKRQGYRVVVCEGARFSEPRSGAARELTTTKSRRAAGGIQELLRARDLIFNRGHGAFGMLILPSAWLYYLPVRGPAAAAIATVAAPSLRRRHPLLLLLGVIAAAAFASRYREQLTMLVFNEWIFLLGWWRVLTKRMDVRWTQERASRGVVEEIELR